MKTYPYAFSEKEEEEEEWISNLIWSGNEDGNRDGDGKKEEEEKSL